MVAARDEGLIAGVGLSNVSLGQLRHAIAGTDIVCVQNLFHLAFRCGTPVLQECLSRGIAFVPFCPLSWPRGQDKPVLTSPVVIQTAARLGITPAQVALQWLGQLAPNVLLIPGTGSVAHLRENLAAKGVRLDDEALRQLDASAPDTGSSNDRDKFDPTWLTCFRPCRRVATNARVPSPRPSVPSSGRAARLGELHEVSPEILPSSGSATRCLGCAAR
jgi:diketogulonate reductase-like aldo/keto reductase